MMNGGVVLIRDTLAAALLVYSLSTLHSRRYILASIAIASQFALRPGTALLLLPVYGILFWPEISRFVRNRPLLSVIILFCGILILISIAAIAVELLESVYGPQNIGFLGRELIADLTADPNANALFLQIQQFPFALKFVLNATYIFLYPFLTLHTVLEAAEFDVRSITLSLIVPIYAFWLNAWFFAGTVSGKQALERQRHIVVAIFVTLLLVGVYSLQTRHKTVIYPLYYIVVAAGLTNASAIARRFGYVLSSSLALVQIAAVLR
jgi:hypothetical protein